MRVVSIVFATALALCATATTHAAKPKTFIAVLNTAQETPPTTGMGQGNALLTFDETTDMLCYYIGFGGLGSAEITAHIHGPAAPGVGPAVIVFPLPIGNPKVGCVAVNSAQKKDLLQNLYYVNIHTSGFPAGEIRGQILRIK